MNSIESKLPAESRFIQNAGTLFVKKNNGEDRFFQYALTMLPSRAWLAHEAVCLWADTTFKSTNADAKQFRIVVMDHELGERTSFVNCENVILNAVL